MDPEQITYKPMKKSKKPFIAIAIVASICIFLVWFFYFRFIEYTDDAYVQGNLVAITPLHPGFVTSIHTDDTFLVKKGQLLVELDRTDAEIALDFAKDNLAKTVRDVCELFHEVFVYNAEIDLKTAELIRDAQDYFHRFNVFTQKAVSLEDYEHAVAKLRAQYSSLEMSGALYQKAFAAVQNTSVYQHPKVLAAAQHLRDAFVRLYRCNIYSPVDGLAAQRTIQVGMQVPAGQPLMSVIPLDQIWVNANFKETQMKYMRLGQKVDVRVDLWGLATVFHGTIVGLPGGAGNAFSLLPPQNLSGNWIKIVQRLPVRVAFDPEEIQKHPLRVGLTCRATVDTRNHQGSMVPDSTKGSPLYITNIFEEEERGDKLLIAEVIAANLDPSLKDYAETPINLQIRAINLPPILEEAFMQDEMLQKEIEAASFKKPTSYLEGLFEKKRPSLKIPYRADAR